MHQKCLPSGSSDEQDSLGDAVAEARPMDPVGLESAQARVAAAVFVQEPAKQEPKDRFRKRYRRLNRLGAGGMGVIYEAKDLELERRVALKSVHVPETSASDALAEAKGLAAVNNPNVVAIYDYEFRDQRLYIVMELIDGQTLRRWAKGRTEREILEAYRQAGEGLAAAHAEGLVHRDFKPDNAIMGTDGRVRVVDFGLACKVTDPNRGTQAPPRFAGTPGYMAPEQVSGSAITAATDQYGFCTALRDALPG